MELKVGTFLEGTVKSITKFGAFVTLPENRTGMVHISEVANCYVSDISQHLEQGQTVRVKVLSIDPNGKIALSVKQALEPKPAGVKPETVKPKQSREPLSFEEKLKQFMSDSDSKISGCGLYERRTKSRRR